MLQMERLADMKDQFDKMKNRVNVSALLDNISSHSANIIANSILQANVCILTTLTAPGMKGIWHLYSLPSLSSYAP